MIIRLVCISMNFKIRNDNRKIEHLKVVLLQKNFENDKNRR